MYLMYSADFHTCNIPRGALRQADRAALIEKALESQTVLVQARDDQFALLGFTSKLHLKATHRDFTT